jgi:starch synthase
VDALEFYGAASWIKGAILLADRVNTVSPSYARELLSAEGGLGMDGVLRTRGELLGILNGIDHAVWNPSTDPHLVSRYDAEDLTGKVRCKADLQQRLGLPLRPDTPVLGLVARIVAQKGLDLLLAAAPRLLRQEVQLVVQGQGDAGLLDSLAELQRRMPDRVACRREWDDGLAHRIYAGSDLFLVPSHFEPCGLSQMYAMRYGSVPVARATGGLRDTIVDADTELTTGTGFAFEDPSEEDLFGALSRALAGYAKREAFGRLVRRVMRTDLSWERGARRYQSLYASLCPAEAPAASASR